MSNSNMMTVRKLRPGVAKTKGDIYRGAACAFEEVRREADQGLKRHRTSLASGEEDVGKMSAPFRAQFSKGQDVEVPQTDRKVNRIVC